MNTKKCLSMVIFLASVVSALWPSSANAQAGTGTIVGTVKDTSGATLPGAAVKLEPGNASTVSNGQGDFTFTGVKPGDYTVTVNYVGFAPSTNSVTVTAGQVAHLDAVVNVASQSDSIMVTVERAHGEAEAINEIRTAENVLNILPHDVLISLPMRTSRMLLTACRGLRWSGTRAKVSISRSAGPSQNSAT
jgi:Carboxypeptidase regulatory-like domain